MRMFVAVLPPEPVVDRLEELLEPRREAADFRWTLPETWHVTLAFLPGVPDRRLDDLLDELAAAAARRTAFHLRVSGGGAFPDVATARLLYAGVSGVDGGDDELRRLSAGSRAAANHAGAAAEGGPFRPHLTLARLRRPASVIGWAQLLDGFSTDPFAVTESVLVRSHLGEGPHGSPRYEVMAAFPLGPEQEEMPR